MYIYILYDITKNKKLCYYNKYNAFLGKYVYLYKTKYKKENIDLKELFGEEISICGESVYNNRYILDKNEYKVKEKILYNNCILR